MRPIPVINTWQLYSNYRTHPRRPPAVPTTALHPPASGRSRFTRPSHAAHARPSQGTTTPMVVYRADTLHARHTESYTTTQQVFMIHAASLSAPSRRIHVAWNKPMAFT
ncbi:hypothetical protein E2C01_089160 [Portunus trituberculatus]|uniref:Uncharacterized protein n=1 Tax=Portunus trituberculatus TaxID=210409 RepID=A0A5B7JB75_PORTR|nr:hypothetical protein [Portunus trituberculatus]